MLFSIIIERMLLNALECSLGASQEVEMKLAEALLELGLFQAVAESDVAGLETGVDVLTARDLEAKPKATGGQGASFNNLF